MSLRNEWEAPQRQNTGLAGNLGMGAVRVALLFGFAAAGLALILTPLVEEQVERMAYASQSGRIDQMHTGSITRGPGIHGVSHPQGRSTYTVRRSVLQSAPGSVCIIRSNGMRTGDC